VVVEGAELRAILGILESDWMMVEVVEEVALRMEPQINSAKTGYSKLLTRSATVFRRDFCKGQF